MTAHRLDDLQLTGLITTIAGLTPAAAAAILVATRPSVLIS